MSDPILEHDAPAHRVSRPPRPGWRPDIDPARCTGCGRCVAVCEPHVLSLEVDHWRKHATLDDPGRCTGCSDCAVICPFHAITMRKRVPANG